MDSTEKNDAHDDAHPDLGQEESTGRKEEHEDEEADESRGARMEALASARDDVALRAEVQTRGHDEVAMARVEHWVEHLVPADR